MGCLRVVNHGSWTEQAEGLPGSWPIQIKAQITDSLHRPATNILGP